MLLFAFSMSFTPMIINWNMTPILLVYSGAAVFIQWQTVSYNIDLLQHVLSVQEKAVCGQSSHTPLSLLTITHGLQRSYVPPAKVCGVTSHT